MPVKNQKDIIEKSKKSQIEKIRPTVLINRNLPDRFTQGDFYKDITIIEDMTEEPDKICLYEINYPLSILLNQDCDLNSDKRSKQNNQNGDTKKNHDKEILWLIFAPVYIFAQFQIGEHMLDVEMSMSRIEDKSLLNKIKQNEIPRFHFLKFREEEKNPEMIIDFKHFFTVSNRSFSEKRVSHFEFTLEPLFREFLSQRFAFYLSRVGLPDI